jgi:ABC-2 type transport system ATP-binding protein
MMAVRPPSARAYRILRSLTAEGRAVLVSSHLMGELQDTADHLIIVGRGRVIADTPTAALLAAASGDRVMVRTTDPSVAAATLQRAGATVVSTGVNGADGIGALVVTGLAAARVVAVLSAAQMPFSEVAAQRVSLEQAYLELTRDAVEYYAAPAPEATR